MPSFGFVSDFGIRIFLTFTAVDMRADPFCPLQMIGRGMSGMSTAFFVSCIRCLEFFARLFLYMRAGTEREWKFFSVSRGGAAETFG